MHTDEPLNEPDASNEFRQLLVHTKRPQWGLAILASANEEIRQYQFQDGKLRSFKPAFTHLFEAVDKPLDVALPIIEELEARADRVLARKSRPQAEQSTSDTSFTDQLALFGAFYPGGFPGETFTHEFRSPPSGKKPLKRHLDSSIARAQELLGKQRLETLLGAGQFADVHSAAIATLRGSTLVTPQARSGLEALPPEGIERFALSLRDVLHGETPYAHRFAGFVAALTPVGADYPHWSMATALPALVDPVNHICVKPGALRKQALWMAPQLRYERVPTAGLYERFRKMCRDVEGRLREAGHEPRDLIDVREFIWVTLRPKAATLLAEARLKVEATAGLTLAQALTHSGS